MRPCSKFGSHIVNRHLPPLNVHAKDNIHNRDTTTTSFSHTSSLVYYFIHKFYIPLYFCLIFTYSPPTTIILAKLTTNNIPTSQTNEWISSINPNQIPLITFFKSSSSELHVCHFPSTLPLVFLYSLNYNTLFI